MKKKISKLATIIGFMGLGLSGFAQANTLVYCSEASPEGFNPQLYTSGTTYDASSVPLYNRLIDFKRGTTETQPALAESWTISEDGKTYTFKLRKDVKFHTTDDFTPTRNFNADDVVYSFLRQHDEKHPYYNVSGGTYEYYSGMGMRDMIQSVEKIDDHTVVFKLTRAEAPFLANLAMDFASILSAEYADNMLAAGTPENVDLYPVGTGPFQIDDYQQDSTIIYSAFEDYWGERGNVETLIFSITPDAAIRYAKMQKDECQVMPYPNPSDIARMKQDESINLYEDAGLNIGYMAFNVTKPPLDNVKVRQALAMAVNKPSIIENVFQGTGQVAKNLIPPTMWGYNDSIEDYKYDLEAAKALLKEAGIEGEITIDLWAMPVQRPYNPNAKRMAEIIQADWAKIGVKANIVTYEWGEYLKRARDGEHDVALMGWNGDNGDPDNFFATLFSCDAANNGSNYARWCDQSFEDVIQPARVSSNQEERVALYKKAQEIMHEQMPAVMIAHSTTFQPVSKRVENFVISKVGKNAFDQVNIKESK
ncbi:ABC transporter substrate-binding protein [Thorsellia kenyensis]|uniref:ABC transporter substrate-binding protein n=1 Tax=Thorsellia kenyensis TaxID=1549888 RepID=A0ABV6C9H1_9GAMM